MIVLDCWDSGSLRFHWLPNKFTSDENLRTYLSSCAPTLCDPQDISIGWKSRRSRRRKDVMAPSPYSERLESCSFPVNWGWGESGGHEATEPRKRPGSLNMLPCEAPLSWPQLPGWPPSPLHIHEQALRPIPSEYYL